MALMDHTYVIPANQEEVGLPNIHLLDHNYVQQLPVVQIQAQQEDNGEEAQAQNQDQEAQNQEEEAQDQAEEAQDQDEEEEEAPAQNEDEEEEEAVPRTYRIIPGIRLNSKFYVDNFGYKYYQKKVLINRITLICELQKKVNRPICHGTASISRNEMDNHILIVNPHNREPEDIDLNVPFLRNALGERAVDRTITTPSIRGLYNSEIIRHPEAAIRYTFLQSQSRAKRMRQSRRPRLPQDMHDLSEMLRDPRNTNCASTFQIPSTAFFNQELIVNGVSVGIIFANISAIERYRVQLATVEMVGIDGTYKTLPQVPGDLRSFLTFQILYKSVAFPMVYVLLGSETEETYSALFAVIRNILPLNYDRIRFVTDYERALMNAV
uniref:MULE transposase domain-containing protein n=2 Tax=Schizaphis graminum TaxID=13262 RepID=A0A2S2PI71_SCHGA